MKMRKTQSFKRRCVFSYLSGSKKMCIPCLFFCFSKYQGFTAQLLQTVKMKNLKLRLLMMLLVPSRLSSVSL
ncbi:hypothetical protein ES319_D11G081700v1 [Gossypium barbadense]|uniref:Uncharacterized protein n=3 Tax=Gossypium TaxID=3633 RepID=A0A5J5P832_GOSBA|nr:hypothetical protein ES319_D11G081700v1 [Gossypium barbadense]TYG44270.1 hypothetical protein ES288_D11G084900v1 [Gossypium darwinii]TYH42763.1 hypothetical protein ES332_D11G084200v1 [Gossypium tomentosum]